MFQSATAILDVAIGLVFVFLLVSLISQQINDKISEWLRMRAKGLEEGLRKFIISDVNFQALIYSNPLIKSTIPEDPVATQIIEKIPGLNKLLRSPKNPISIPSKTFATVLFDTLIPNNSGQTTISQLRAAISTLPPTMPLRDPLLHIISTTENDIAKVRSNIEGWFDTTMEKTTQLYKAHMWRIAWSLSMGIAVFLNVDTISVGRTLWTDSALRTALVAEAGAYAEGSPQQKEALEKLRSLNLPIGWSYQIELPTKFCLVAYDWYPRPQLGADHKPPVIDPCKPPAVPWYDFLLKVSGWLITAFAGAQGAPFWFEILRKATRR